MIHCLTSDTDPMRPTQTTPYIGENVYYTGKTPVCPSLYIASGYILTSTRS